MPSVDFKQHCEQIVRGFLLTAVVVDDELSLVKDSVVHDRLTKPSHSHGLTKTEKPRSAHHFTQSRRALSVDPITSSFARHGMICGVLSPHGSSSDHEILAKAAARADIVILDWRLDRRPDSNALPLLEHILANDQQYRLRLIAFYTGEDDHDRIRKEIVDFLKKLDKHDNLQVINGVIRFHTCRIVLYGKPSSRVLDSTTIKREEELADQLISDFTDIVNGLLPILVLAALTAVRENVFQILNCFDKTLDPAWLSHRVCLPQPSESEGHIVEQIASELFGIMNDAVIGMGPAGIEAIEMWLSDQFENHQLNFGPGRDATLKEILKMLRDGFASKLSGINEKKHHLLSYGFSGGKANYDELDRRLASIMAFRQVLDGDSRQLSMGTVIRRVDVANSENLLCVTPRCDSVRLTKATAFLFLPLVEPRPGTSQVVVPVDTDRFHRLTISMNPAHWRIEKFEPDPTRHRVLAGRIGSESTFVFKTVNGESYQWIGELKADLAQSIAQSIATRMSRVPLNQSEWIRRSERLGKRKK